MVTLENHVSSILARSAKAAADEIITLFDSSFEAFSEELRKRQEEIDTLRRRLEATEAERLAQASSAPAYLCVRCGLGLGCLIPLEGNQEDLDTGSKSARDSEADCSDQSMVYAPIEESDTEQDIEIEVPTEEGPSCSGLILVEESGPSQLEHQEEPAPKEEESNPEISPKSGPQKRARGRPRRTAVEVPLESPSTPPAISAQEQPNKAEIQKESATIPEAVHPSDLQTSPTHDVSKTEPQTAFRVYLSTKRSGRRGRPPRHLLEPLLMPFAKARPIFPEKHELEPETVTNELQDKCPSIEVSSSVNPVPIGTGAKVLHRKGMRCKFVTWVECSKCPRQFPNKTRLLAHMKNHQKKGEIKCSVCGMTFIGNSQMNNHMRAHTGEKPYRCDFCSRRYPNLYQYKKHMLVHTTPDYACEVCGLRASQMSADTFRKAHLRRKKPCSNCASIYT